MIEIKKALLSRKTQIVFLMLLVMNCLSGIPVWIAEVAASGSVFWRKAYAIIYDNPVGEIAILSVGIHLILFLPLVAVNIALAIIHKERSIRFALYVLTGLTSVAIAQCILLGIILEIAGRF